MNSFRVCRFLAPLSRRLRGSLEYRQAPSSVRRTSSVHNFKRLSSETTEPIATKFHIQPPPGPLGKKRCSIGSGHMTNMAAMPIYGKNLKKIFFSRTNRPMALKLSM